MGKFFSIPGWGREEPYELSGRLRRDQTTPGLVSQEFPRYPLSLVTNPSSFMSHNFTFAKKSNSGGAYIPNMSTCFLTSNLLQDLDPWAVSQGNRRVDITKLEFYGANKVIRDKVRCPERSYMAAGAAVHPSSETPSIIFCTQGSLHEAAGLVCIEARRPHTPRMLLNNFHGKPFNSPGEIVSNPVDNSVYFTVSK